MKVIDNITPEQYRELSARTTSTKAREVVAGDVIISGYNRYTVDGSHEIGAPEPAEPGLGGPMFVLDTDIKPLYTYPNSTWSVLKP